MAGEQIGRLEGRQVDRLAGWQVGRLEGWHVGRMAGGKDWGWVNDDVVGIAENKSSVEKE